MNIKVYSIALLSICTAITASENSASQYPFSDYDKKVFTNHSTNKVELVYSTPFIESISNDPMTIDRWELERLSYPALTRIVFKQHDFMLRFGNDLNWIPQAIAYKEESDRYWAKEAEHSQKLQNVRLTIEKLQEGMRATNPNITISTQEVMRMVQYVAQKIEHYPLEQVGIRIRSGELLVVHGVFAQLLAKYRAYEQQ